MNKVDLKKYDNQWFVTDFKVKIALWLVFSRLFFRTRFPVPMFIKIYILKSFGADIGKGVVIKPSVNIKYPWNLIVGDNSWIGEDVWIDNLVLVSIGNNCCLSQGCYILTGNHDFTSPKFDLKVKEVNIHDESWVGAKGVVCPGVVLQRGSILTVGSIATRTMLEYGIYQGNPAVKVKDRVILD